ncbi:MAG: hypothetical protein JJU36_17620 [Phycisphaeraceae bacterium]|nr:hypothetical protein [Phycisphaeraceae bacterium]
MDEHGQTPDSVFDIRMLGAVGDGRMLCTAIVQSAIDQANARGGGIVWFPPGLYKTGTLFLKSNVTVWIGPGATLLASENIEDYPRLTEGHNKDRQPHHFIVGENLDNVAIIGSGTIDGNGPRFWHPQEKPNIWIREKSVRPSPMIDLRNCRDVRLVDILLTNSPGWTCHLHDCDRTNIRGVRIRNNLFGPNTDGFDITGCHDLMMSDCLVETGDDAIVLKTLPDSRDNRRITVTNCVLRTNCVALKLGCNESFKDMRQVTFSNCIIHASTRAIGLYTTEGGVYQDIAISNIVCDTCVPFILNRPIHIDARKRREGSGIGAIRNVLISNFIARTDGRVLVTAADGTSIENLTLRDIRLTYPRLDDPRGTARDARSSQFSNHSPEARSAAAALVFDGVRNLVIDGLQIDWPDPSRPVDGEWLGGERVTHGPAIEQTFSSAGETSGFSALWLRDVKGGRVDASMVTSSDGKAAVVDARDSNLTVLESR